MAALGLAASPAVATARTGCSAPATPGTTTTTVSAGGHPRTVIVHVPAGTTGMVPLVLDLHGSQSSAAAQEGFSGMDATADADGFVVAYPQALLRAGSGYDWNVPGVPLVGGKAAPKGAPDDVAFVTGLVGDLEHSHCIDPARVYVTGFSGGARMASQLACDASGTFAAVAPVSGLRHPTPCRPARAVPVLAFHGTADPVDPYRGHGEAYWTYSVPRAAAMWGAQDGCAAKPTEQTAVGYTLTQYTGCRDGASVELASITGEGHEWPGGPHVGKALTDVLGPQSDALDANGAMWTFFAAHPRATS